MGFAPLQIPLSRRAETFAALIGIWIGFLAHTTGVICWLVLFFHTSMVVIPSLCYLGQ